MRQRAAQGVQILYLPIEAAKRWVGDECLTRSAAIAFFSLFSLSPTLVLSVMLGAIVWGREATERALVSQLQNYVGPETAQTLQSILAAAWQSSASAGYSVVSMIAIVIGASATFVELRSAVAHVLRNCVVARTHTVAKRWFFAPLIAGRVASIAAVAGIGFMLMISLAVDAWLALATAHLANAEIATEAMLWGLRIATSLVLMAAGFALLMKILAASQLSHTAIVFGALVCAIAFSVGKFAFSWYLTRFAGVDVFGTAGSLAVLLMWLFFTAAVFLYGVAIAAVFDDEKHNSGVHVKNPI